MDFLDPKKRRRHDVQLILGYVLVGIAILMATTVLIYYANGFGVSRDGSLVQRGLVFVSSQPTGADLYVNGKKKTKTNAKLNLATGRYNVAIKRPGYVNWTRNIIVEGSSVDHYVYPLLFPRDLMTTSLTTLEARPSLITQSPDKRWLMAHIMPGDTFAVYDLKKEQTEVGVPEPLNIPADVVTTAAQPATWEFVEWSTNNRHVLMKRSYAPTSEGSVAAVELILVDIQRPEGSHNLTRELGLTSTARLSLRDKSPDTYYIYNPDTKIVSVASIDKPIPVVLQRGVLAFKPHGENMILYATDEGAADSEARIILRDDKKSHYLRSVPRGDTYLLDLARYDGDWYVAAGSASDGKVFLYENPIDSIDANSGGRPTVDFVFKMNNPMRLSFSANAQFLAVQNGKEIYVHDAEFNRAYRYIAPEFVDGQSVLATWVDGHRLTYVSGGRQVVVEYDGINDRILAAADEAYGGYFDRDNRYVYTFSTSEGAVAPQLLSTPLRTPDDL